jgi:hypothetical protein
MSFLGIIRFMKRSTLRTAVRFAAIEHVGVDASDVVA